MPGAAARRRSPAPTPLPRQGLGPQTVPDRAPPESSTGAPAAPDAGHDEGPGWRSRRSIRLLAALITALLVVGLGGFLIDGADRPADPRLVPVADPGAAPGAPGVGAALLSVSSGAGGAGPKSPVCLLEAATRRQQDYGLMNRTSVAPYAGMAFVFATASTERFYMRHTLIALSIAWFDPSGRFEAETLMAPCPDQVKECPTYGPGRPYTLAVEVPAGRLGALGIGPGAVAHLGGPCG